MEIKNKKDFQHELFDVCVANSIIKTGLSTVLQVAPLVGLARITNPSCDDFPLTE